MSEETWSQNRAQLCMGVSNIFTMQKDCPVDFLFQHVVQDASTAMPVTACRECYVRKLSNALLITWSCKLQKETGAASTVRPFFQTPLTLDTIISGSLVHIPELKLSFS